MKQKKGFTGNRYSKAEKADIVKFVEDYDAKNGRGGIATAQRKFKVSYIALRNWIAGSNIGSKKSGAGVGAVLAQLQLLKNQMKDLERAVRKLKKTA